METKEGLVAALSSKAMAPEFEAFLKQENEFMQQHKNDTNEDLIRYIKACADELNHIPAKHEIRGFTYIKSRLGPWPRILEKAGLKQRSITKSQRKKAERRNNEHIQLHEKPD